MWPKPQETEDLVTFTKEILNVKLLKSFLIFWVNVLLFPSVWTTAHFFQFFSVIIPLNFVWLSNKFDIFVSKSILPIVSF